MLVVEKGEPAQEASHAAGGMIAYCDPGLSPELISLAAASAHMYPQFVLALQEESGESADLRDQGTIAFFDRDETPGCNSARLLPEQELTVVEPMLVLSGQAYFLPECSVDPRGLGRALVKAAKHRGVDFVTGSTVTEVVVEGGCPAGVKTDHSFYPAEAVVNCAGAWASQLKPVGVPTHPVKGQIVCVVPQPGLHHESPLVQHVIRTPDVYIIPRSDGRILLGATVEDAGFDKRVTADAVQRLYQAAANAVPEIGQMRIHDAWAGLRPASPDKLPIIGATLLPGYFAASGHYRDGIMLAPITAHLMTQLLTGNAIDLDLAPFSPLRFN